jgi:hypothetical protein
VPATHGLSRLALEARRVGRAVAAPPGRASSRSSRRPRWAASPRTTPTATRARRGARAAERQTFTDVALELEEIYEGLRGRRRARSATRTRWRSRSGSSSTSTCTRARRTTAASPPALLLDHAEAEGLGAIAITDHNVFSGALEVAELARGRDIVVIPARR